MSLALDFKSSIARYALAATVAFGGVAANDVHAESRLQEGECLAPTVMMDRLASEGQFSKIIANRIWGDKSKEIGGRKMTFFTGNENYSLGYQIEGSAPFGEQQENFCVIQDFSKISVLDGKSDVLPAEVKLSKSLSAAVTYEMNSSRGLKPVFVAKHNDLIIVVSGKPGSPDILNGMLFIGSANPKEPTSGIPAMFNGLVYSSKLNPRDIRSADSGRE
jgi:hypothetical protein